MSISTPPVLPSVTQSGRTLTPSGRLFIADSRPRLPTGGFTFTNPFNNTDGAVFDVYAYVAPNNQYTLLPLAAGTAVVGRIDVVYLGQAVDYPTLARTEWRPADGGSLANHVQVTPDGRTVRIGPTNANAQQIRVDRFGRLNAVSAGGTTFALGTGAGTGATNNCVGTDQSGVISIVAGSGPVAGGIIATVTFSQPYRNPPWGVLSSWFGASLLSSFVNRNEVTVNGFVLRSGSNLTQGGTFEYQYFVLGGD
jgi:hypothetical protein